MVHRSGRRGRVSDGWARRTIVPSAHLADYVSLVMTAGVAVGGRTRSVVSLGDVGERGAAAA